EHLSVRDGLQACRAMQEGGFSRPRRAHDGGPFAAGKTCAHVLEGMYLGAALSVNTSHMAQLDRGHGIACLGRPRLKFSASHGFYGKYVFRAAHRPAVSNGPLLQ